MGKRFDVIALGELLIDFTQIGISAQGNALFEANPGGAPCNVLAMLKKLGRECAFIGKVGQDSFGVQLRQSLESVGIDTGCLLTDPEIPTTLAIVHNAANGDRDFSFYRNPGADVMLSQNDIPGDLLANCRVFHFGSLSLTHEGVRKATQHAVELARQNGAIISFDPNLRPPLWKNLDCAKDQISWGLSQSDVVKISDNEIEFMTGEKSFSAGANNLMSENPNIKLLCVTAGADGSYSFTGGESAYAPAFHLGGTIETTGAGDTFCACMLHHVLDNGLEGFSSEGLNRMLRFANAAAYLVTTKRGALKSMPSLQQIEAVLSTC